MKASHCDECLHFRWEETTRERICDKQHKPRWYAPTSNPHEDKWGWKRVCTDFEQRGKKS